MEQEMKIPLHSYQKYCKDFALSHPFCGLFLRMGLGKTAIILEMLWELNPNSHVLIIAPKTIARCTWQSEIDKWNMNLRTQSLIVNQKGKKLTKKKREELYATIPQNPYATVYFINRDLIPDLVRHFPKEKWPFKILIIDESQSFKNYGAERFKALKSIRPYVNRIVELTGSPTPKGPMDLWSQIYLLDMGYRLGANITAYRNQYFNPGLVVNGYPVSWSPKPQITDENGYLLLNEQGQYMTAEEAIYQKIKDIVISMKNTQIQLPAITYHDVDIYMNESEKKLYKEFAKKSVLDLDGLQIEAKNAAVLSAKLSQMASGSIYTNPKTHEYKVIHENKLDMCEYIVNNTDSPVLIAYHFKSDMDMLLKHFEKTDTPAVVFDGSPEMQTAWNQGKYPVMLLQPASCGFGVNLQEGGSTLIWYTIPWSLEEYEQTNARIYRQGQKHAVFIHHLLTKGTIDKHILNVVQNKDATQEDLLNAVEVTLEELNSES